MTTARISTRAVLALCAFALLSVKQASAAPIEESFVFETWNKQRIDAYRGSFKVPENRKAKGGREITIKYVRLAATGGKAGPPIVYLAGGPGASGIQAINYRYRMFMAMRRHGDVIALDQRGTGDSNEVPKCTSTQTLPVKSPITDRQFAGYQRDVLRECLSFWKSQGVDVTGYDTVQSALDLEALRRHLGVEKIVLWGTSYGSHLALAALREMPGRIERVVISSVEGLNQTIKLPARSDDYFDRLQAAIDAEPEAKAVYPDVKALLRRVHAQLEREPARIQLKVRDDQRIEYLLQRRDMQMLAAGMIADPRSAAQLLGVYLAVEKGVENPFDRILTRLMPDHLTGAGEPITLDAMPVAMDIASGVTADRRREVFDQSSKAILGSYLDSALMYDGMAPELDLGDAFRAGPVSDVPVLALSGTLDGRTTIDSQREALAGLTNVTMITVENAGHNLFDEDAPAIQDAIDLFMTGNVVPPGPIKVELPDMKP